MAYRSHISKALASASVHLSDIIVELAKAQDENHYQRRMERLREAQLLTAEILRDIDTAIETEGNLKVVA